MPFDKLAVHLQNSAIFRIMCPATAAVCTSLRHTSCCCSISIVYKALCTLSRDTVIIKAYEKGKMKTKNFLRMEREIKLMKCLVGEGLAQLYGVFEDSTHKTLVMEYCKGGDLFKLLLLKGGTLDEHWVCVEASHS